MGTVYKSYYVSAVCIILVGAGLLTVGLTIINIKWNHYVVERRHLVIIGFVFSMFIMYQGFVVFAIDYKDKFTPYSAFFLNLQVIPLILLVFLRHFKE